MKLLRCLLPVAVACGFASAAYAAEYSSSDEITERDFEAVADFVKGKRDATLQDKLGNLNISGDVRAEYDHLYEKVDGVKERGSGSGVPPKPTNVWDIEFNLMFDYQSDRTWAHAHVEWDNNAGIEDRYSCNSVSVSNGIGSPTSTVTSADVVTLQSDDNCEYCCTGSGSCSNVCLKRAYVGYNVFEEGSSRFDVELGRRKMHDIFESEIQFQSRFDGLLLRYSNSFEGMTDMYVNFGAFIIDEVVNHVGYVGEVGFLDIAEFGFDVKYSYIDWSKDGYNRCHCKDPLGSKFKNSQLTMRYNFDPELLRVKTSVYGAYIHNHDAKRWSGTNNKDEDDAWYIGVTFGGVEKEGDWACDINYQHCEAQAVSDCDQGGITRGNTPNECFVNNTKAGLGNYKGWRFEALYAMTDNWTWKFKWEYAKEASKPIAGKQRYSKVEVTSVYAF